MSAPVEIAFDCLPLRSVTRLDVPLDASPEFEALFERIKRAIHQHGSHNSYYLHTAKCVFHLTNHEQVGMLEFRFEGTVLTDEEDSKTLRADLAVELRRETCDWLTEPVVHWFAETVTRAVIVEFDRFIAAGDLERTKARIERLRAESDEHGGYVGMGI